MISKVLLLILVPVVWLGLVNAQFRPEGSRPQRPPLRPQGPPVRPSQSRRPPLPDLRRPERQPSQRPFLQPGNDLERFQIKENTPVGEAVYTLKGVDPKGRQVFYTISGDNFSVDRVTGVITLKTPLDRERKDLLDVRVTIEDEEFENLIPFRRQIKVVDVNDNAPRFSQNDIEFAVDETEEVGETIYNKIGITDADSEDTSNSVVKLICDEISSPEACETFDLKVQGLPGDYRGMITLKKPLNYEARSSYNMLIKAEDQGIPSLSSTANVLITINDIQDQKPFFLNGPYSISIPENIPPGTSIFEIQVRDGDTGIPRKINLEILGDRENFFELDVHGHSDEGVLSASLLKTEGTILDRELPSILSEGGLYAFQLRATEILENGVTFGEQAITNVTLVITDQNDMLPTFNRENFTVVVPEDVGQDTPLPDLNMIVSDGDISRNAEYDLVLEDIENSEGVFSVYPTRGTRNTPVTIRVADPSRLDNEKEVGKRFIFKVNAVQEGQISSSALVFVLVKDANDNAPIFGLQEYQFSIREDMKSGDFIGVITAEDMDSNRFGLISYEITGFGADKFRVHNETGELFVNNCGPELLVSCLDYETRESYSLLCTATDGGGQHTTTRVKIDIIDVNDNYPRFEVQSYKRAIPEGAIAFEPSLIVKATDLDGPTQGNGQVYYSIKSVNTDSTIFDIDETGGEITLIRPARSDQVDKGIYSLVVRATDAGNPPLYSDVKVTVTVGSTGNQKPIFGEENYQVTIKENTPQGTSILNVNANDPDGPDTLIRYAFDAGAKDNFVINEITGEIKVSQDAILDIQENGDRYEIQLQAIDRGTQGHFAQTAQTTVTIFIEDVNDKKPKFERETYTMYVSESTGLGQPVLQVEATDMDRDADLEYDIVDPITARDKTGNILTNRAAYDFGAAFAIDPKSGQIFVQEPLSYSSAAVIILTIQVTDLNADLLMDDLDSTERPINNQFDTIEVTFYIQAYKADSPQFPSPWTPSDPVLSFDVDEELPKGTVLFKLTATDPLTGQTVAKYEKLPDSDPNNLIDISPLTGEVINNQILDYESRKEVIFRVRAIVGGQGAQERTSDATITINLKDVNDNYPIFDQDQYSVSINENVFPESMVQTVRATDRDTGKYGEIVYSIEGQGSDAFTIDPKHGHIQVKAVNSASGGRSNIDRERQAEYRLNIIATDTPNGGAEQRSNSAIVYVTIEDVNDTPPIFSNPRYSAVVPENSEIGTVVSKVMATDPDLGQSGEVTYLFPPGSSQVKRLFEINSQSGEIKTAARLTGKGRTAPYVVTVRAMDQGTPQLFSDTEIYITVGDVSNNDGIPRFIKPEPNEVAYVPENSSAGTQVFKVEAFDPDDPLTSNGKIVYSLPDDGTIVRKLFQINPETGILSTKVKLDREERQNYTLILDIEDLGSPPQQTSTLMHVVVTDVDDHAPVFRRQRNSVPVEFQILEEQTIGTQIGQVQAVDQDEGDNAIIDYAIIDGNDDRIFSIKKGPNNIGILTIDGRLDREFSGVHLLTIKCFRPYEKKLKSSKQKYNSANLDEIQVKINVEDIDDNAPKFLSKNGTLGVRVNAPIYTEVAKLEAVDIDADSRPVNYFIEKIKYFRPRTNLEKIVEKHVFIIDQLTGVLQTNETYTRFADGYFQITIKAMNAKDKHDTTVIKVYVLQDTELMKFVFNRDPTTVQRKLPEFKSQLEGAFAQPYKFNIYDTEFYSKVDGSLDFGRTSSCFQVMNDNQVVDLKTSEDLFKSSEIDLTELYQEYDIIATERCAEIFVNQKIQWVELSLLVIAALIGFLAFIATIAICCFYSKYKRLMRKHAPVKIIEAPVRAYIPTSLPPGSIHGGPSIAGSDGRVLYDWQESTIPMDAASYRSLPNH